MRKRQKQEYEFPISHEELVSEIANLNALIGEWSRMQHQLIDKATAAQLRLQALYKRVGQRHPQQGSNL